MQVYLHLLKIMTLYSLHLGNLFPGSILVDSDYGSFRKRVEFGSDRLYMLSIMSKLLMWSDSIWIQHLSESNSWRWKFKNFLLPSQADFEFKVKNSQEQRQNSEDLKADVMSHVLPAGFPSTSSRRLAVDVAVPNLETSFVKNTKQNSLIKNRDHNYEEGYEWCFRRTFLFDFLLFVFSENVLAISKSFFLVAEGKKTKSKNKTFILFSLSLWWKHFWNFRQPWQSTLLKQDVSVHDPTLSSLFILGRPCLCWVGPPLSSEGP